MDPFRRDCFDTVQYSPIHKVARYAIDERPTLACLHSGHPGPHCRNGYSVRYEAKDAQNQSGLMNRTSKTKGR